jgi:hypothetical protein
MPESFIFPTIISLPLGYDCTVVPPLEQIAARLCVDSARLRLTHRIIHEGDTLLEHHALLQFDGGILQGEPPEPFTALDGSEQGHEYPGYLEMTLESEDDAAVFHSKIVFALYSIYSKAGKKGFLSDNAYKYGAPPVIAMMALYRRFVDTYPVIRLDRERDLGETLALINPYHKAVLAQVATDDGRKPLRLRVPAMSVRSLDLCALLNDEEPSWAGQVQLTANNRLIVFNMKHSLADPRLISDHEHLDPFRADTTHIPATLALRRDVHRMLTGR